MSGIETVFASLPQFLLVCLILAAAEAVYVLLGFGAGLIAVGSWALLLPELRDAVVILLLVNLPAELYIVRTSWRQISWRGVLILFAGVAVGIPLGSWFLRWGDPSFLLTVLGFFLVAVSAIVRARRRCVATGREALVGRKARVRRALNPEGTIFLEGELWSAVAEDGPIARGEEVEVLALEGFRLRVRRARGAS